MLFLTACLVGALAAPDYSNADAAVLSDEVIWTLHEDGSIEEAHHRRVKILADRAHRRHADPRICFWNDVEEVRDIAARVIQADGTVVESPEYGRNLVTPGGHSGWPAFAEAREWVISFSGIEPGAVLELAWRKVTKAGVTPWMWADICLSEDDPVESRTVVVSLPHGKKLMHALTGAAAGASSPETGVNKEASSYRWTFSDLPADPDEPQAPSWRERSPRLLFTTCPDEKTFVSTVLDTVEHAASPSDSYKPVIDKAAKDALDPLARLRATQRVLHDSFNFLDHTEAWERFNCRPAPDVFDSNYGNVLESGALLVAMLRAASFEATTALLVEARGWNPSAPIPTAVSGIVARVELGGQTLWLHPNRGPVTDRTFPDHIILGSPDNPKYEIRNPISAVAELSITGRLKVESDGQAGGELKLRLTGHTFDPEQLRSNDDQKAFLNGLAGRVVEGLLVDSFSVIALSDAELAASAVVKTSKPFAAIGDRRRLALGMEFPFLLSTPLPLATVHRRLPVVLTGSVCETLDLRIDLPDSYHVQVAPSGLEHTFGDWGTVTLSVDRKSVADKLNPDLKADAAPQEHADRPDKSTREEATSLAVHRHVRIARDRVAPSEFIPFRAALNDLRADSARTIIVGKKDLK